MDPEANDRRCLIGASHLPTETTSLLGTSTTNNASVQIQESETAVDQKWVAEVLSGETQTTWRREASIISKGALPLIITYFLQYSLTVASVVSAGRLGTSELGGVTLGMMSVNITGFSMYMGLTTSLDTMCAQAFGSGKKELVGVYVQRMLAILAVFTIPVAFLWFFSAPVLALLIPDEMVVHYTSRFLKIMIFGLPGFACFETGKRFMQAQGLFSASTCVMAVCAPLNAFMNWFFVWKLGWGFEGAPIAVAITDNLLPLGLILYAYTVAGRECWGGFSKRAFQNWGPMISLGIPGFIMLEAELVAFNMLTFAASHIDTTTLAAQSIVHTIAAFMFQIPFPVSVVGSTRIGNLIGASLDSAARTAVKVTLAASVIVGLFNALFLSLARHKLPYILNSNPTVVAIAARVLPLVAAFQLGDAMAASTNGILRGVGLQRVGSYVQLFCYYAVGIPISFVATFKFGWGLIGLWSGVSIALALVPTIEILYIRQLDWQKCVDAAMRRNRRG